MEPLVFVYYLCNTKKHVQVGGLNGEKDVEALRKKLNCSELRVTLRCKHVIIFVMITGFGSLCIGNVHGLGMSDTSKYYRLVLYLCFFSLRKHHSYSCELIGDHSICLFVL